MDWKRAVLLFFVMFTLGTLLTRGLDYYFAKQAIARDAALLDSKFRLYFAESERLMNSLPEWDLTAPCDATRQKQLRQTVFDASFLRWIGVYKDGVFLCQNGAIDRDVLSYRQHRVSRDYSLAIAELKRGGDTGYEIGLVRHMNGYQYVASFTPLYPNHFIPLSCENCLAYRIEFESEPLLDFGFKAFKGDAVVRHKEHKNTPYYKASFELSGNKDFLEQYYQLGTLIGLLVGLGFGTLAVFGYWAWHKTRNSLEYQIRQALKSGEFVPYYQPIVDSETGTLVGAEVLMRWLRNDGTLVPPNHFIPFAEASGLVLPMTRVMLDKVVADIAALGSGKPPLFFSVNIVPAHLYDDSLLADLEAIIASGKLGAHRLSLEITERLPLTDIDTAQSVLERIYGLGVDLKLDDAGTGYGCFTYVQNLGVSTLKIDKMFIDTIGQEHNFNGKTLDAIISFAKESELKMIAEGVENEAQLAYLRSQGVSLIQGYVYSKPLDAKTFFNWKC
ncbi:EAL domain-containing protein [Shewanella sp. JM162201]|uniref:EAL domain-containing protein n=1 Tax=Shewanella jiangmenensis TaxID=2837387 RepID=A0ABS5V3D1_9GAMM|nr:EAL domain-containing protein [Shewanella jiangmenensis]MBT1444136.1 EAL domain-containing protein [Shewanella jiangmenensis]